MLSPLAFLMFATLASPVRAADPWRVTVLNHGAGLGETPVVSEIQEDVLPGLYMMKPDDLLGVGTVAQVFIDRGKTYLGAVLPKVPGKGLLAYTLTPENRTLPPGPGVELRPSGTDLDVRVDFRPLMTLRNDNGPKPYIYPLIGPTDAPVTRAYPMKDVPGEARDHPHQRSLWFTHGNVNGTDFWASDPLNKPSKTFGSIKETRREVIASGARLGVIRTANDWLDSTGKRVCSDERVLRVFLTQDRRIFDFDVTMKATDGPVTFGDTKEGMFGLRVASSMDVKAKKGGKIINAEGITDDDAWGKPSSWVDYTGPVEGQTVGVAVLNHPSSFRYPTTWHVRGYGLFAANPFGWHDFGLKKSGEYVLPAGERLVFRYRVILHKGDTASSRIADAFRSYAEPLKVEVAPG